MDTLCRRRLPLVVTSACVAGALLLLVGFRYAPSSVNAAIESGPHATVIFVGVDSTNYGTADVSVEPQLAAGSQHTPGRDDASQSRQSDAAGRGFAQQFGHSAGDVRTGLGATLLPYTPPAKFRQQSAWRSSFEYCRDPPPCVEGGPHTDANKTVFIGLPHRVKAGETIEFAILARDSAGNNRMCGGDAFQIEITGPSVYVGHPTDNFDGTHSFAARLFDDGVYTVRARLDYRACGSSTRCQIRFRTILIEWIAGSEDGRPVEVVVERADPGDGGAAMVAHARGRCGMVYDRWATYDDPSLRMGRWKPRETACATPRLKSTRRCQLFQESPYVWDPLPRAPAGGGDEPFTVHETPAVLAKLRNVWMHSVGDSLSRNLHLYMVKDLIALNALGPLRRTCYRIRIPSLAPDPALPTIVETDSDIECGAAVYTTTLPSYLLFLYVVEFPETNVTLSYAHFSERQEDTSYQPWRDGLAPWTDPTFLARLAPPSAEDLARSASQFNSTIFDDDDNPLPVAHVRATRSFDRAPFVRNGKPALPTHFFINIGLHYTYPLLWLEGYGQLLESIVARLRRDFPPANTVLVWRSTAQTQFYERTLPGAHRCRTYSRVAHINEVATEIIRRNGIPVVDYLQYSLGRQDACPDNRHYTDAVELEIANEMFDIAANCPPPAPPVPPPPPAAV